MKKFGIYIGILLLAVSIFNKRSYGQIINGAYQRRDVLQKQPTALPSVREADVLWSKKIWRIIDVREKINQPLYYPTTEMDGRSNLITLLLQAIENKQITASSAQASRGLQLLTF